MHNVVHNGIVTLMIVNADGSRILAEAPPVRDVKAGMVAMVGQIRGEILMVTLTPRDSETYQFARALAGDPLPAAEIYEPYYVEAV